MGICQVYERISKAIENDTYEKQCARAREEWSFPVKLTKEEQRLKEEFDDYFGQGV